MTDHVLPRSVHQTPRGLTSAASRHAPLPGQLELHRLDDRDAVTLVLAGELDMASAPQLDHALREVEATDPRCIIVDLRDLAFMDSTGLALLIRSQQSAEARGHRLALRRAPHQVRRLFKLTGTADRFTFEG